MSRGGDHRSVSDYPIGDTGGACVRSSGGRDYRLAASTEVTVDYWPWPDSVAGALLLYPDGRVGDPRPNRLGVGTQHSSQSCPVGRLIGRDIVRLVLLGPADMPEECQPRASCIGDLSVRRAVAEALVPTEASLLDAGYVVGEQFGYEREGRLVAQHGVLLFKLPSGASVALATIGGGVPPSWRKTEVGVGDGGVLAVAQHTSQVVWQDSFILQVLMMRGYFTVDILDIANALSLRARAAIAHE